MENHERVERELLKQCGLIAILVECFAATMRRVHRVARKTLSCQASAPRRWTQTIRGGENRGCKIIEATFRAHWWRVREWQQISYLARD